MVSHGILVGVVPRRGEAEVREPEVGTHRGSNAQQGFPSRLAVLVNLLCGSAEARLAHRGDFADGSKLELAGKRVDRSEDVVLAVKVDANARAGDRKVGVGRRVGGRGGRRGCRMCCCEVQKSAR